MIRNDMDHTSNDPEANSLKQKSTRYEAFICYSRQDGAFAEALVTGLTKLGRNVSIDRHDIRGGEAWQRKLGALIQNADNVIFLISAAALASPYCRWELDYAAAMNKRLINVVVHPENLHEVPASISAIQYINADGALSLDQIAPEVVLAIETDQDWAEYHTQLALRAQAWREQEAGLLRGSELKLAENQLLKYQGRRPFVTELQSTLLLESQRAQRRRFRWAAVALIGVTLLAAFGINTWIGSAQEEAQRLLGETRNYFVSGDQVGALVPLNKLAHPSLAMGLMQDQSVQRSGQNLFNAWASRLVPLQELIDLAPANSLLSLNDHPVLKLPNRTLKPLEPKGDFRLAYNPFLSAYVYADASLLSVHEPEAFKSLLTLTFKERAQIVGIYPVEALKMVLVAAERRQVTNDEDEPSSINTDIYAIVRKSASLGDVHCIDADGFLTSTEVSNPCIPADAQPANGDFAVYLSSAPENYRMAPITLANGTVPSIKISLKADCKYIDECDSVKQQIALNISRGNQPSKENVTLNNVKPEGTGVVMSSALSINSNFPAIRPEAAFWKLQNSSPSPTTKPLKHLTKLDFSRIENKDDGFYEQFFEDGIDLTDSDIDPGDSESGQFFVDGEHVVWRFAPGGNSWSMAIKCHFDTKGVVTACSNDMQITVIDAEWIRSPVYRYLAHRVCSSTESSLSIYDMAHLDAKPLPLEIPSTLVLGFAFNPSGSRLAVLTDQHELWIYAIKSDGKVQREKIMTLPGKSLPIVCDNFFGHPIDFADDKTLVGVDQGSILFAANVERSEVLWTSKGQNLPATLLDQTQQLIVNTEAGIFLLNSSNNLVMFDTGTGLPISDAIDTDAWKTMFYKQSSTDDIRIDKAVIEQTGQISVASSSFNERLFIRNSPTGNQSWPSKCMPLELLTGLDREGRRMNGNDLLRMYSKARDCGK